MAKEDSKDRNKIIVDNFLHYLKLKDINQSKYAEDNYIDKSTISKWKKLNSIMSAEQIYQAANYFNITVNDLYYTEEEKKKIFPVGYNDETKEIMYAKRVAEVKRGPAVTNSHILIGITTFLFSLILLLFSFITVGISSWFLLIPFLLFILIVWVIKISSYKIEYVIDIKSDIFYTMEDTKNKYFLFNIISKIISIIISVSSFIFMLTKYTSSHITFVEVEIFISILLTLFCIFNVKKQYKKEVYYQELYFYWYSLSQFLCSVILLIQCLSILVVIKGVYPLVIAMFIDSVIKYVDYCLISKKHSEYDVKISTEDKPYL